MEIKRRGGKYELAGFLLIVTGIVGPMAGCLMKPEATFTWMIVAGVLIGIGLVVFLIGRFM